MVSIIKATEKDYEPIVNIGRISVEEAHRASAPASEMSEYIQGHYNKDAITKELEDPGNIYHIISYNNIPAGFSKIIFNASHPGITAANVAKLDRIYLLKEFQGLKLGFELLKFNVALARQHDQSGIWLFTWVGNAKAIDFYLKTGFKIIGQAKFKVSERHYNDQYQMLISFDDSISSPALPDLRKKMPSPNSHHSPVERGNKPEQ